MTQTQTIPEGWKTDQLGSIANVVNGFAFTSKSLGKRQKGLLPVFKMGNIVKGGGLKWTGKEDYYQGNACEINKKFHTKENDILMSMTDMQASMELLGYSARIKKENFLINQRVGIIRPKEGKVDPAFLFYYMNSHYYIHTVRQYANSGVQVNLTTVGIKESPILIPSNIKEQQAIASVLSSLDDKIELLREQNKTLENIAQTLFHEWFVKFNFPGATGEMVDSELGEIPEGRRVYKLSELVKSINGYSYKGKELVDDSREALVTLKSFNRDGGFQTRGFKPFMGTPKEQQEVQIGDLIVAHTDLTQDADVLGNPAFIFDDGGFEKLYITMDLVKVVSKNKNISNSFYYYLMKNYLFKGHCIGYANGTTVLHLSKRAIPEYEIALPKDLDLVKSFSGLAEKFTNKISINVSQIEHLSKTRDTLLPKLMSGEVRVKF